MTSTGLVETRVDVATIAAVTALYGLTKMPAVGDLASKAPVSIGVIVLAAATWAAGYGAPHARRDGEHHADGGAL